MIRFEKLPTLSDPRYIQLSVLLAYAVSAREFFNMDRPHLVTLGCCCLAALLDVLIGVVKFKTFRFPISALIIGLATSLLIDSRYWSVYFIAASLGIFSKAFITVGGRHIFNPANFGVVCVLAVLPQFVTGIPSLFGAFILPSLVFLALGVLTVWRANQRTVSFSWLFGFILFSVIRGNVTGSGFLLSVLPILSPSLLLFSFHMISDPATAPDSTRGRVLFGFLIAAMDGLFRLWQLPFGNFYALFAVAALLPLFFSGARLQNCPAKKNGANTPHQALAHHPPPPNP
jgi:Na+-transporting NADH:ubiquinone oxidoreductase subunit NqrB